ncbi:MAG: AI-2E family transporter [Usitatibacter sp.]
MREPNYASKVVVTLALVAIAVLLWKIVPVLMLVFAGIVFATALRTASDVLTRRFRMRPAIAVAIVVVAVLAALGGGGYLFGERLSEEAGATWEAIGEAQARLEKALEGSAFGRSFVEQLHTATSPETLAKVAKGTFTAFGVIADIGLVLFLAVYLAIDPATYRKGLLVLLPAALRPRVDAALGVAGVQLRKWLLGQLGAMATVGILIGVALALVGVRLALPLGILSALLEFVPVVGPIAALVIGVLVALAQDPGIALYAAIVYGVVLFVEGNVIIPLAQKWAVALPPALGLIGIAVFGILFGLVGVLFAMPLLVVVVALVQELYVESDAPPAKERG